MKTQHLNKVETRTHHDALGRAAEAGTAAPPCSDQANPPRPLAPIASERASLLLARAVSIYGKNFAEMPEGGAWLKQRGIADAALWSRHRVGYSNARLTELLPREGVIWSELKELGLLLPDGQERFAGCVVFPVTDPEGRLSTVVGLHIGEEGERYVWLLSKPTGLWNAPALKTYAHIVLVQSILDGLSVEMAGHQNVISLPGPGGLSACDVATLTSYGVQRITLLFPGGKAGRMAVAALQPLLSNFRCESRDLPQDYGPNSHLLAHGPEALSRFLADGGKISSDRAQQGDTGRVPPEANTPPSARPIPDGFAMQFGLRHYEIRGLEKGPRKLKATVRVEHAGKLHVDTLDFYSARWRRQLAQDLTRLFDESAESIQADITKLMTACEHLPEDSAVMVTPPPAAAMTPAARAQAEAFGKSLDLFARILEDFEHCGLVGERANKLLCYLASVSRKMDKPLSVLILSSSGAGKTTLQDAVLAFCPPEDLVKLTSLSGKALFYKDAASLKHKVLALEEGDGVAEAMYALRNLISAGELVTEATIKDSATGRLTTMENRVEGPTAVFLTTTNPAMDPETKSRFFVTSVDESRAQTHAILAFQRQRHTLAGLANGAESEPILQKHWHFQRLLKPLSVVNPFADQLSYGDDRLQSRRDQPKYLTLIKAVAFLRQMQKPVKAWAANGLDHSYIEVDREDIRLANELAHQILGHSLDELSRPAYDLLTLLDTMAREGLAHPPAGMSGIESNEPAGPGFGGGSPVTHSRKHNSFTRRQIREFSGWSNVRVHRHLQELIELEFVLVEHGRNGVQHRYRLAYDGQGRDGRRFMLGLKPVEELND
jgi:DNA primase